MLHRLGSSHGESRIIRRTYPQLSYTEMMEEAYQLWYDVERQGKEIDAVVFRAKETERRRRRRREFCLDFSHSPILSLFLFGVGDCSLITRTGGLDIGKTDETALINVYNSAKTIGVKTDVLSSEQVSSRFPLFKLPKVSHSSSK